MVCDDDDDDDDDDDGIKVDLLDFGMTGIVVTEVDFAVLKALSRLTEGVMLTGSDWSIGACCDDRDVLGEIECSSAMEGEGLLLSSRNALMASTSPLLFKASSWFRMLFKARGFALPVDSFESIVKLAASKIWSRRWLLLESIAVVLIFTGASALGFLTFDLLPGFLPLPTFLPSARVLAFPGLLPLPGFLPWAKVFAMVL